MKHNCMKRWVQVKMNFWSFWVKGIISWRELQFLFVIRLDIYFQWTGSVETIINSKLFPVLVLWRAIPEAILDKSRAKWDKWTVRTSFVGREHWKNVTANRYHFYAGNSIRSMLTETVRWYFFERKKRCLIKHDSYNYAERWEAGCSSLERVKK